MTLVRLKRKVKTFVDVSLAFEPNPLNKDLTVLKNERAINNSLKNLIFIAPKEVPFTAEVGSNTREYLFDQIDIGTAGLLKLEIERTIEFNEPRVEIVDLIVEPHLDRNEFMVNLTYRIVGYDQLFYFEQILSPTR